MNPPINKLHVFLSTQPYPESPPSTQQTCLLAMTNQQIFPNLSSRQPDLLIPVMNLSVRSFLFIVALSLSFGTTPLYAQKFADHLMGPTGLRGATEKKEINITKVDQGSPADGNLKVGDVVIGVDSSTFSADPRRELAKAIDEAEGAAKKGRLILMLKGGKTAEIQLKPYGDFSDTAPYNCTKTKAIVTAIADEMIKNEKGMKDDGLPIGHLGLMATGEKKYIDYVRQTLSTRSWAKPDREACLALMSGGQDMGYVSWSWGYALIALSEYQLLTGDKSYMPAIETYALALAKGQCASGTWGHRMISSSRRGRLPGYSHINQPSLTCFIGLALAQKCGVKTPELQTAVWKCTGFFNTYVGKGTIPYGVHNPNSRDFNNNGMSGSAALAMSFVGDKEAASFFSRQVATAYDSLESGHANYFFNVLWSPLGTNVAGPEVTSEYHKRSRWLYTLYRTWDDRFTHNGIHQNFTNTSGALLLNYCTPRKALYITGKNADPSIWAKPDEAMDVINQSQIDYKKLSVDGLIDFFDHEAPQIRRRAVWIAREHEGKGLDRITSLIRSGSKLERHSAMGFFGFGCPPEWAGPRMDLIGEILRNTEEDLELRTMAAQALCQHQPYAKTYYEDMLRLLVTNKSDDSGILDGQIAESINATSQNPFADGLVKDKKLFYDAVHRLAYNPRQEARGHGMRMIVHMPAEDFPLVADEVKLVAINNNPKSHSYHSPRQFLVPASQLMARLGIKEGTEWVYQTLKTGDGKETFEYDAVTEALKAYGANSKEVVGLIQSDEKLLHNLSNGRWSRHWKATLEAIEKDQKPTREMISFEDAKNGKLAK
jgi:hypothetical protein